LFTTCLFFFDSNLKPIIMSKTRKFILSEDLLPQQWYNIMADMPNKPLPPLHPGTKQPIGPEDLSAIFPMELIKQEVTTERYVDIPEEVRDIYRIWRPTPLVRAINLEKFLDTPAKIYYKNESVSPAGSHKPNTAVPQAYYNYKAGIKKMTTETGAGQWGSALAFATQHFNIDLKVFMVKISYTRKPYRKSMMNLWGADVIPSPSNLTDSGRAILAAHPDSPGSLGIAISEAVEMAAKDPGTNYSLGSVLNHVILHQTVIGLESLKQMEMAGDYPDIVLGCFGGGSNFGGISFPFLGENFRNGKKTRVIAVEPASCPKLTRGQFHYDFGDTVGLTPLIPMYTLGHDFIPDAIHAGGLRYHGAGAIVSQLLKDKLIEAMSIKQLETFKAGMIFAKTEGTIPAPESCHAIAATIREAEKAKVEGKQKTILFNLSGHGIIDLASYDKYFEGQLSDHEVSDEEIAKSVKQLDKLL
jgi:tryptophan synthase beta chain